MPGLRRISSALQILEKGLFSIAPDIGEKLDGIAKELREDAGPPGNRPTKKDMGKALAKTVLAKLPLLENKTAAELTPDVLKAGLALVLKASGNPAVAALAPLSLEGIDWIVNKFQICGAENANPPSGDRLTTNANREFVIRVFVEEKDGEFALPTVTDRSVAAVQLLMASFNQWEKVLKLSVVQTGKISDANLVVTSDSFAGKGVDEAVLALTDIGPPGGLNGTNPIVVRMVFDSRKSFSRADFVATSTHEFGHAIGVRHRDVNAAKQLMNPMLSEITKPKAGDIAAAVAKGWTKKATT